MLIERWGIFELSMNGKSDGNPFIDYEVHGTFIHEKETLTVNGFYDGDGIYMMRFCIMPKRYDFCLHDPSVQLTLYQIYYGPVQCLP